MVYYKSMPQATDKVHFEKVRSIFFFVLIAGLTIAFAYLIWPFLYPLFWAAVLAILFYPLYERIHSHLKIPGASSFVTILIILALVIIPFYYVGKLFIIQSLDVFSSISQTPIISNVAGAARRLGHTSLAPYIGLNEQDITTSITSASQRVGSFLLSNISDILENSFHFVIAVFVMFYCLYYLFKDGPALVRRLIYLSPLGDEYERLLVRRFTSTTRATLKGTFIIGTIQGVIGGVLFYVTDIQGALIWGVLMAIGATIPALGAWVIWAPIGILNLAMGHTAEGVIILAVGGLVISLIDNLLRPILVGKDIQMHPLLVFLSTVGGIVIFGISGFVIGPVIAALFLSVMSMYDYYYENELRGN